MKIFTTDPDAALSSKRGASEFAYYDNYLIDHRSCIMAGVVATPERLSQEIVAARQMLERAKKRFGLEPASVTADKSYGNGEFLSWLSNRQMRRTSLCWIESNKQKASTRSMTLLVSREKTPIAVQKAICFTTLG